MRRAQLILKGLFNCFVTLCVGKSAFFELETIREVDIYPIRPHHASGTHKIRAQVLQREFISRMYSLTVLKPRWSLELERQ